MNTSARLRVVLAIALGTLTVGCAILFLGRVTDVHADPPESWYVSPSGSDTSPCGVVVTPCQTINNAISEAAQVGATVFISPGTFTASVNLSKVITLAGAGSAS